MAAWRAGDPGRVSQLLILHSLYNGSDPHIIIICMPDNASPVRQPAPPASSTALEREVADLIVQALNLDVAAAEITLDAPLYGEGLGLDSIDILEIALVVSKQYGIQLRADSEENEHIFRSLRHLVDYIAAHRTK
jgi:acyl carrier protein